MNIKQLKRVAQRFGCKKVFITNGGGITITHPHNGDVVMIGYYTGKNNSVLDSTIEVEPEYNRCSDVLYKTEAIDKHIDLAKNSRLVFKDQEFDPLEYLFTGAPIIIEGSTEWFLYDKKYDHDSLRLPTVEESPLNMKLAWHHQLGKPEGIDDYYYIVWSDDFIYPAETDDWSGVTAFMLLKKKEKE